MNKRILMGFVISLSLLVTGCSKIQKKDDTNVSEITNNKSEITIYMPEGQILDKKYTDDDKIAINYLPHDNKDYVEDDINTIVNNIDKNVKVLVISSDKKGLQPIFNKVKEKFPGIITVGSELEEFNNGNLDELLKDTKIDVGFNVDREKNGLQAAINAREMNAKRFVYLYNSDGSNEKNYEDISEAEYFCNNNGVTFSAIDIHSKKMDEIKSIIKGNSNIGLRDTAVFSSEEELASEIFKLGLTEKIIIPNLNTEDDGKIVSKVLGLDDEYKKYDRVNFEKILKSRLKDENYSGKIGIIYENKSNIPIELTVEIAKYMYKNRYMIEECYRDVSLIDRGNQNLDLKVEPIRIGASLGYFRLLRVTPRIY